MARANAYALLVNGADDAEIATKMDISSADLSEAIDGWQNESLPFCEASDKDVDSFVENDLKGFIALTMGNASPEARREFSDQAAFELAPIPFHLLGDAMAKARRTVSFSNRLIPFVFEQVDAKMEKLRIEGERLAHLARIADGRQN